MKIVVSVDTERPGGVASVAAKLRAAGVEVTDVLEDLGTILASCSESQFAEVAHLEGVLHVERERGVGIPPPTAPVQ